MNAMNVIKRHTRNKRFTALCLLYFKKFFSRTGHIFLHRIVEQFSHLWGDAVILPDLPENRDKNSVRVYLGAAM